jgi:hypothetical protein
MKTFRFLFLAIIIALLTSCSANDPTNNSTTQSWLRINTQITYASDGTTEAFRVENTYDVLGRMTGQKAYTNGKISSEQSNYVYNGQDATYDYKEYTNGNLTKTNKMKSTYCADWIHTTSFIWYETDNTTEKFRQTSTYDTQGRQTSFTQYTSGALSMKYRDYNYNGYEVTYFYDYYVNGNVSSSTKYKIEYCSDWSRTKSYIYYKADNTTEAYHQENTYDTAGRQTGLTAYSSGILTLKYRDYVYNGKEVTYYIDQYATNGTTINSTQKIKLIYN